MLLLIVVSSKKETTEVKKVFTALIDDRRSKDCDLTTSSLIHLISLSASANERELTGVATCSRSV